MKTNHTFSVLFWINKSKMLNGAAPIYLRITVNGKRCELSTKRSISPEKWNSKTETAKGSTEEARQINSYINLTRGTVEKHYMQMMANDEIITAETIKNRYMGVFEKKRTLLEVFDHHNLMMEGQVSTKEIEEGTWGKYETAKQYLSEFMKYQYKRSDLALSELTHKFVLDFEYYLKTEKHNVHNTAMAYVMKLKKVITHAISNEWMDKHPFITFKCRIKETSREFLTKEELIKIMTVELSENVLERARDIFVFQCYTGYAYAEAVRITKDHLQNGIDGNLWCSIQRNKTRNKTTKKSNVPLLPIPMQIIEKYENDIECRIKGTVLPMDSNHNMNIRLKRIAKLCGIQKDLTTHIGRHTFATTVTLTNGVPIETVSSMLGHSQIRTTQIYAKVVESKVSEDMNRLRERLGDLGISQPLKKEA